MATAVTLALAGAGGARSSLSLAVKPAIAPYDVIVPIIQSNMRGVADDYVASDQYGSDSIKQWDWSSGTIVPAVETLSTRETTTGMGASNTFVKDYAANRLALGRRVLVVNTARGGTGFSLPSTNTTGGVAQTALTWDRTAADDANNMALRTRDALLAIMAGLPAGSKIVAYIANHGSTDGSNNMPKATFKAELQDWITWLRTQMSTPTVPYIMMQMRPDLIANETRHAIIDAAQTETAAEMANVYKASSPNTSDNYRSDSVHFNAQGMRTIGHNLFALLPSTIPVTPAAVIRDTFTDTAGVSLIGHTPDVGATYKAVNGATGTAVITAASAARQNANVSANLISTTAPPTADYQLDVDLIFKSIVTGQVINLGARVTDSSSVNTGYRFGWTAATQKLDLRRVVAGTSATLGTWDLVGVAGNTNHLTLAVKGAVLTASLDGTVLGSVTDASPITAVGYAGFSLTATTAPTETTQAHFDNFVVMPL